VVPATKAGTGGDGEGIGEAEEGTREDEESTGEDEDGTVEEETKTGIVEDVTGAEKLAKILDREESTAYSMSIL